ncbi:nitrite reductase (NAD(P)H) small subunit [Paenibacillus sp. S-38]|uniref:nitrite reductase (NAD(P)H) small subunit n=1 Tax=Paenibacillus sp. S-38 TaxID=3416710 RepID=UPI003CEC7A85
MDTKQLTYVGIGRPEDFEERIGRVVRIGGDEIAVFRTTEGEFFALENRSPGPRGGTLADGIVSGAVLFDPICDWRIGLRDGAVLAPDHGQVRTYPVRLEGGEVRVGYLA